MVYMNAGLYKTDNKIVLLFLEKSFSDFYKIRYHTAIFPFSS